MDEDVFNKSAIDIFNRIEQLEIISDYDAWKALRELRNELAHDYGNDDDELAEKLYLLFNKKFDLERYFNDVLKWLDKNG